MLLQTARTCCRGELPATAESTGGIKWHNIRQKYPGLQKRPITFSAATITEGASSRVKPWTSQTMGGGGSPQAPQPASLLQRCRAPGWLLLLPAHGSTREMLKYQQGGIHGRDGMQTETPQHYLQKGKWSLLSFRWSVCIQDSSRENTFFQQANPRLLVASGKLKRPQRFFPHRVLIWIKYIEHVLIKSYILKYNGEHHTAWTSTNGVIPLAFSGGDVPQLREECKNRLSAETCHYVNFFPRKRSTILKRKAWRSLPSVILGVVFNV